MSTITIDPAIYRTAEDYAKEHNVSIATLVEEYFKKLTKADGKTVESVSGGYYISPKIKALQVGFKCKEDISFDYKTELKDAIACKYK